MARSRWRLRLVAAALGGVLVLAGCGGSDDDTGAASDDGGATTTAPALTKSEIAIGVPAALTGTSAQSGGYSKYVAEAWGKWVNENGGIAGHPVKVIVKDSGPDAVKGLAAAKTLVEQDKVLAIVGDGDPGETSFLSYLQEAKVPAIGGGAGNPVWYSFDNSYLFPLGHSNILGFESTPYVAKDLGAKSMMQVVCAEIAGCLAAETFAKPVAAKAGIDYKGTITVSSSAPNYTAECLSIKAKHVDYVHLWVAAAGVLRVIQECEKQGVKDVIYAGSPGGWSEDVEGIQTHRFMVMTQGFPWYVDAAPVKKFRDVMDKYGADGGSYKGAYGTYTWASLEYFRQALEKGNVSDSPTRDEIVKIMYEVKGLDADGLLANKISFTQGQKPQVWRCYFLQEVLDGKLKATKGGLTPTCTP